MTKENLLALGLSEEQSNKVLELTKDTVPYGRFKEVNDEKNELKEQLSKRDEQLKELAKITKDNENLNSKIKELQETNKNAQSEYESKLARLRLDNEIELALTKNGAKNNKAVKAMLDLDNVKFENEKLVGLSEQLEALQKSDGYLFKGTETINPVGLVPKVSDNTNNNSNGSFKTYNQILSEFN